MTTLPIKRRRFTDFSIENILREPFQVREFDQNRSNATWICLPVVHFSDLSTSLTSIWSSIIKLAILSAVPGDFLRVSVSPVSGEKNQDPPGPFPHLKWQCSKYILRFHLKAILTTLMFCLSKGDFFHCFNIFLVSLIKKGVPFRRTMLLPHNMGT